MHYPRSLPAVLGSLPFAVKRFEHTPRFFDQFADIAGGPIGRSEGGPFPLKLHLSFPTINQSTTLPAQAHTLGYARGCDQEQGVIKLHHQIQYVNKSAGSLQMWSTAGGSSDGADGGGRMRTWHALEPLAWHFLTPWHTQADPVTGLVEAGAGLAPLRVLSDLLVLFLSTNMRLALEVCVRPFSLSFSVCLALSCALSLYLALSLSLRHSLSRSLSHTHA